MKRQHFLLIGPLAGLLAGLLLAQHGSAPALMAGITTWMAVWWISEAVPIAVTSLLPLVLFPLLGITGLAETAANYGKEIIFLFLGGFLLALGIERSGLHRRIALHTVLLIGGTAPRLVLGMMVASALLSMWINSTATVLVMLPIALSLVEGLEDDRGRARLAIPLLLGVSYGSSFGGMATPVGTPPNLVLLQLWDELFPGRAPIGFGQWMAFGVPLALVLILTSWWVLVHWLEPVRDVPLEERGLLQERLRKLGRPGRDEKLSGAIFLLVALLWITGDGLSLGALELPGWRDIALWGRPWLAGVGDAAVAVAGAVLLFVLPTRAGGGERLMDWEWAERRVPWGVLLLIGAGMALALGIERSGLDAVIGGAFTGFATLPPALMLLGLVLVVSLLSELGSNTATASLVLPILARSSEAFGGDPVLLLVPATLAASLGFMLPIASHMQTIIFATGVVPVRRMVRAGLVMDLLGAVVLVALYLLLGRGVFG